MYTVFASSGKQHRVEVGSVIDVEKLESASGTAVDFTDILLVGDNGGATQVRAPMSMELPS